VQEGTSDYARSDRIDASQLNSTARCMIQQERHHLRFSQTNIAMSSDPVSARKVTVPMGPIVTYFPILELFWYGTCPFWVLPLLFKKIQNQGLSRESMIGSTTPSIIFPILAANIVLVGDVIMSTEEDVGGLVL
jgi:hypothetical protein